ncbi:MAG: ORC1-type DNA replication protein [Candidatus Methanofastidiosia archaeon]
MKIRDMLMSDETLFKNEQVFNPNYVPDALLFRDKELQSLVTGLKPGLREGKPQNTLVIGPPGTGKTTTVHFLFGEIEKASDAMVTVHVNCKLSNTKYAVFSEIHRKIFGFRPPETGVPYTRIYEKVMGHLKKKSQSIIVALDDIDYLFEQKYANDIMYDILRAYEHFPKVRSGVVAILSKEDFKEVLTTKLYSIFMPQEIFFPPYSLKETYDILLARAREGFYPGVISDEVVRHIAELTVKRGDLRVGINLLSSSGLLAEAEARKKIEMDDVDNAYKNKSRLVLLREKIAVLSWQETLVLKEIARDKDLRSGALYLRVKEDVNKKSFSNILSKLEAFGLIDTKVVVVGRGRSRKFLLRYPEKDVLSVIDEVLATNKQDTLPHFKE